MQRPGGQPQVRSVPLLLSGGGLLAAVAGGSWWVADAVVAGSPVGVMVRMALAILAGWYYLVLCRLSLGRPALPRL